MYFDLLSAKFWQKNIMLKQIVLSIDKIYQ